MPDTIAVMKPRSNITKPQLSTVELSKLRDALDTALERRSNGSVALTDELLICLRECRGILQDLVAEVADTREGKEQSGMDAESIAVISLAYGFVVRGDRQPLVLIPGKLDGLIQKSERVIREINAEIQDGISILGDRNAPFPVSDSSDETLRALSHVLATRTQESVQLILRDGVEARY